MSLRWKHPVRGEQPATSGLGAIFTSPIKWRYPKKTAAHTIIRPLGQDTKCCHLLEQLSKLEDSPPNLLAAVTPGEDPFIDMTLDPAQLLQQDKGQPEHNTTISNESSPSDQPKHQHILPDEKASNLYTRWNEVLPGLIDPLLSFNNASCGKNLPPVTSLHSTCIDVACTQKPSMILCLFQDCEYHFHYHELARPYKHEKTFRNCK